MASSYAETAVLDGELYCLLVRAGAAQLRAHATEVNNLNVFPVPDGDTGDNMSMTAEGGVAAIASKGKMPLGEAAKTVADGMLLGARGNSGVILSQFFSGIAKGFEGIESAHVKALAAALECGVEQAYGAVMTPTEGTILTVCREGVRYAADKVTDDSTVRGVFADMKWEMYDSLRRTPDLLPVLKEAGVIDSGGAGLYYMIEGMLRAIDGEETDGGAAQSAGTAPAPSAASFDGFTEDSVMEYGYCTECLMRLQNAKCDIASFDVNVVKDFLTSVGNSVVCFCDGSIVKLHVHTMEPEKVLGFCRQFGEFLTVKIENMSVQHTNHTEGADEAEAIEGSRSAISHVDAREDDGAAEAHKEVGVCVVCTGEGIADAFRELGADEIIDGGQTNNPSAGDFIAAFDKIDADVILAFPNNTNIILAAKQAAQMYKRAEVRVIESRDIGMGYVALSAMDLIDETDAESLTMVAEEAMKTVTTGLLSTSVRDANIGGVEIKEGEYIGFIGKRMITSKPSLADAAKALIDEVLASGEKFMLTAFCGSELPEDDKAALEEYLAGRYADVECYFLDGGQDVYPLIFIAE